MDKSNNLLLILNLDKTEPKSSNSVTGPLNVEETNAIILG